VKTGTRVDLLPGEWAVLGVIAQGPTHGFAVAETLAPDGPLGRVWTMSRPRVYRAITDLAASGMIKSTGPAPSTRGPTRVVYKVTATGQRRLMDWMNEPVAHVRDVRSGLLLKLAFLDAAGLSAASLLKAQRSELLPILGKLEEGLADASAFDSVVFRYRVSITRGVLEFLDGLLASETTH